jgi:hypothetical protein
MKKIISLFIAFAMLFLCSCQGRNDTGKVKVYTATAKDNFTLNLHTFENIGYNDIRSASDLISTAQTVETKDMFEVEKFKIEAVSQTPPKIAVVNGEVYAAVIREDIDERAHLYKFERGKQKELYTASDILSMFEHNGCLFFYAYDSSLDNLHKLMKYDPKAKTFICLNQINSSQKPIYRPCGDYISITGVSDLFSKDKNGEFCNKCNIIFCDFSTKEEIFVVIYGVHTQNTVVAIKDVKNNYYVTHDKVGGKLIFEDVESQKIVSQASLNVRDPYGLTCKIFGSRLLLADSHDIAVYDYADDSCKLIYKREAEEIRNCGGFGIICEIIGDVLVFCDCENLYAYNMKNNTVATICPLEDVSYSNTDNEKNFAFCEASPDYDGKDFCYVINNYRLK